MSSSWTRLSSARPKKPSMSPRVIHFIAAALLAASTGVTRALGLYRVRAYNRCSHRFSMSRLMAPSAS